MWKHTIDLLSRCELISICIFTWGFTSKALKQVTETQLWIDFNLYFYVRIHKPPKLLQLKRFVVNWFQFVFLREDSQVYTVKIMTPLSCELISICIFTWGFTRHTSYSETLALLWIDFNLYFYVRIHKTLAVLMAYNSVVNWFQFVFLREDSQVCNNGRLIKPCCELISICIFTWGFTSLMILILDHT